MFEEVKPIIETADLAYANVETMPIANDINEASSWPYFATPIEIIDTLIATGFDVFSLASNHSLDQGIEGVTETISVMNEAQTNNDIIWSGLNASTEDQNKIPVIEVNGVTISFISFTDILNSWQTMPNDYAVNVYSEELATELVNQANEISDVQIVSMHWGVENTTEVSDEQQEIAEYLASLGVDIILGSHPHVVQPTEMIDDCLVIYSMGNFLSGQESYYNQTGVIYEINFTYDAENDKVIFNEYKAIPTMTYYDCLDPNNTEQECFNNFMIKTNSKDFNISDYNPEYQRYLDVINSDPNIILEEEPIKK